MRSTIHLVTAHDMRAIAPVTLSVLARTSKSPWAAKLAGADVAEAVAAGISHLAALRVRLGPRRTASSARSGITEEPGQATLTIDRFASQPGDPAASRRDHRRS
jgi:hypothetical protein